MFVNIIEVLKDNAIKYADNIALEDEDKSLSWKELDKSSDSIAQIFLKMGYEKGCHIGLSGKNSVEWAEIFLGILKFGGIPVLLNTQWKTCELEKIVEHCDIECIIYDNNITTMNKLCSDKVKCICFSEVNGNIIFSSDIKACNADINAKDTACIIFTSGSTAMPKAVMLSHENILSNSSSIVKALHWNSEDKMCICVPMFHCFGLTAGLISGIVSKAFVYIIGNFRNKKVFEAITIKKCNILSGVPSMFLIFYEKYGDRSFLGLKSGIIAGSPILLNDYRKILAMFPKMKLLTSYGQSETSPCVTVSDWDTDIENMPIHSGKAIDGVSVKIDSDFVLKDGENILCGEILVKGVNVMQGYYNNPIENEKIFTDDGWLRTGDLGYLDRDGNLYVKARKKDIIIKLGEKISPMEIEEVVYKIDGIKHAKVCGIPEKIVQEEVALCIVTDRDISDEYIIEYLKQYLSEYKLPKKIFRFDSFPSTSNGKIDIAALKNKINRILDKGENQCQNAILQNNMN